MRHTFKLLPVLMMGFFCASCVSIGRHRVQTPTPAKVKPNENRVVVILLDRVNQKTFTKYLKSLWKADFEPRHLSGLSLLARNQFKLANAAYAQSSIPATTSVTEATILTGVPPIEHGLLSPRQRFYQIGRPPLDLDLTTTASQTRFFLTNDWSIVDSRLPTLFHSRAACVATRCLRRLTHRLASRRGMHSSTSRDS